MQDANLWDVSSAPTIVMTQRGARKDFQESLRAKGVEVVQFDFLTPEAVAAYCQERGFLQVRSCCRHPNLALYGVACPKQAPESAEVQCLVGWETLFIGRRQPAPSPKSLIP